MTQQTLPTDSEDETESLRVACGLRPLTARLLISRGYKTPEEVERFFAADLQREWIDPDEISGLNDVADAIEETLRSSGRILVFGDYDADGVTATATLMRGLKALGADVCGLIPHRYDEGYALSDAAIERALTYDPDLIVTVDCGISCAPEVEDLRARGVRIVVTDHHEPGEQVPGGIPISDPKCDENSPSHDLAGSGVALKLVCMLGARLGKPDLWRDLTDLVTLGTIGDLMPLVGENRALVADGVSRIRNSPRPAIDALLTAAGIKTEEVSADRLAFSLIPTINAAGRMGDATQALDLLLCDDAEKSQLLAAKLVEINQERRNAESELARQVEERLESEFHGEEVIVIAGEGWHEGVKGITASRIARKYKRPTFIFTLEDGKARGSGRSYGPLNLFQAASTCTDLFEAFGGHDAACGLTLAEDKLDEFRTRICKECAATVPEAEEAPSADVEARLDECDVEGFEELQRLAPFGTGNTTPHLLARNVFLDDRKRVGKNDNHLRFKVTDGITAVPGIQFNAANIEELVDCESACDIVFEPSIDEWKGHKNAQLMVDEICPQETCDPTETGEYVEELFGHEDEICDTGDYAGITQAASFNTKIVGVTFENRQDEIATLEAGEELQLVREPANEFDPNAIAVLRGNGTQLGYLNRQLAARLAPVMDEGVAYDAAISAVTGRDTDEDLRQPGPLGVRDPGITDRSLGVNIVVRKSAAYDEEEALLAQHRKDLQETKERWRAVDPASLTERICEELIGTHDLHPAQTEALEALDQGASVLAVMATGRGKSLIFHTHAARCALLRDQASIFIYPLRALVADQSIHLMEVYERFGLTVQVLTGETDEKDRADIYESIRSGAIDVILTTPEFFGIHAESFAESGRIGFVVVDEAHHIGLSKAGTRPAYADLGCALEELGNPQVLACTATADDEVTKSIIETLSITRVVLDPSIRENLHIDDRRDLRDRASYLASLVAAGGKCVAYVNSRDQTIQLARMLRHRLPGLAPKIGFYNAGLPKDDRKRIENAFREGDLVCIISTSAFGEGIDIPDIEHVVLYHLPFNDIEFNQMSGRSGRDGRDATIHLLYSYGDARINEKILSSSAPTRDALAALYHVLSEKGKEAASQGDDSFTCTNAALAEAAGKVDARAKLDESAVSTGISVFRELGFLQTQGHSVSRSIRMVAGPDHMDLSESVRYREGCEEIEEFDSFKTWALSASADDLLSRFNRPILPSSYDL